MSRKTLGGSAVPVYVVGGASVLTTDEKDWLDDAIVSNPTPTEWLPVIDPATATNLVVQVADGTLVDAGYAASEEEDPNTVVLRTAYGGIRVRSGDVGDNPAIAIGGYTSPVILYGDPNTIQAGVDNNGVTRWVGAGASANREAQRTEILASALRPTETPIVGTTHTFTTANEDQIVVSQSSDPTIFTIPLNSAQAFAIGAIVGIERQGSGTLAVTATAGVTLNGTDGASKSISSQWGAAAIRKISINGWVIVGAIA
jgi:hypothetical protein